MTVLQMQEDENIWKYGRKLTNFQIENLNISQILKLVQICVQSIKFGAMLINTNDLIEKIL